MATFVSNFWKKVEIFGQFHETVILAKKLKLSDSAAKKLKLSARGFAAAASFNFFAAELTVSTFSQITVS